jgi:release factor glutamine methyltransferase
VNARAALREAEARLAAAGVDTPRVDAEWLVAHALGTTRGGLYARFDDEVELDGLLTRREAREPLAYVLGEWGFRRLTLKTDPRALVPRPETEIVVERALALLRDVRSPRVLDIGVGSGAIALALKDERPDASVVGVDVSRDALSLARENAVRLGLAVELREDDESAAGEGWDLVVSNPPYVDSLEGLQPELRHEPRRALVGEDMHARIAAVAETHALVFEVGAGQAQDVAALLGRLGYRDVRITPDLAGIDRVVEGLRAPAAEPPVRGRKIPPPAGGLRAPVAEPRVRGRKIPPTAGEDAR